jgi:hypothetical protein
MHHAMKLKEEIQFLNVVLDNSHLSQISLEADESVL